MQHGVGAAQSARLADRQVLRIVAGKRDVDDLRPIVSPGPIEPAVDTLGTRGFERVEPAAFLQGGVDRTAARIAIASATFP